jgi:hypothetical protein
MQLIKGLCVMWQRHNDIYNKYPSAGIAMFLKLLSHVSQVSFTYAKYGDGVYWINHIFSINR